MTRRPSGDLSYETSHLLRHAATRFPAPPVQFQQTNTNNRNNRMNWVRHG
jgi:hypothetical protein